MKRDKINVIIGIIILLTTFSGFPREIKTVILSVGAAVIVAIAFQEIRKVQRKKTSDTTTDAYVESKPIRNQTENISVSESVEILEEIPRESISSHNTAPTLHKKRTYTRRVTKENLSSMPLHKIDDVSGVTNIINE